jgi:hypothetical protein
MTDVFTMSAEAATAQLSEMTVAHNGGPADAPSTPEQAGQKLEQLWNDPAWRGRFEAGHSATRQEWETLMDLKRQSVTTQAIAEGSAVAPTFETIEPGGLSTQNKNHRGRAAARNRSAACRDRAHY